VIVNYLHILGTRRRPIETDPVLVIDPNGVLPFTVACQGMKLISRRAGEILQLCRSVNGFEFAARDLEYIRREALRTFARKDQFRHPVPETLNHRWPSLAIRILKRYEWQEERIGERYNYLPAQVISNVPSTNCAIKNERSTSKRRPATSI
jgi:hypothetical protein